MSSDWSWYDIVDSPTDLQQGDILENLVFPELRRGSGEMVERAYTAIVMTQSCDIEDDIRHIVLCPIWTREQLAETIPAFKNENDILPKLTKGHVIGFYPLSKCTIPGLEMSWKIVQFHRILEVERTDVLNQLQGMDQRRRLRSPYRESLSQHFARFFMRVGLPISVDASPLS